MKVKFKPIASRYWLPNSNYLEIIIMLLKGKVRDNDFVIISEKAICVAKNLLVDESRIKPKFTAKLLARFWMRIAWGYFLGYICRLRRRTIKRLRNYPIVEGSKHKQLVIQYSGFLQALRHVSEGGIDVSNIAYSYAALPLRNAKVVAKEIRDKIKKVLNVNVNIMITDTDMTYSFMNFHFTPRPFAINGIFTGGGILTYMLGRFFKIRPRATPIAYCGENITIDEALDLAHLAHNARGYGAGRTPWDMAEKFGTSLTEVGWEMLSKVKHYPIVIVRKIKNEM